MGLNESILGAELDSGMASFNTEAVDVTDPVALADFRKRYWNKMAQILITHIHTYAVPQVPGTGLAAPGGAITGISQTGKIL